MVEYKKKKILITGSSGMLGKDIISFFSNDKSLDLFSINRSAQQLENVKNYICDLTDFKKVKRILNEVNPDIIIHCAACVNLNYCEQKKQYAYQLNTKAVKVLASFNPGKTKLIYISTDSVFDGIKGNYSESSIEKPLNYYAYTKLEGEKLSKEVNSNTIIIRTNIYGYHNKSGNSLAEWGIKKLNKGETIIGFSDVFFNPVYTMQLAEVCYELLFQNYKGVLNIGSYEEVSKYDFLVKLANQFGLNSQLIIKGSIEVMNLYPKRPKNTTLNVDKVVSLTNIDLSLENGLKKFHRDYDYNNA